MCAVPTSFTAAGFPLSETSPLNFTLDLWNVFFEAIRERMPCVCARYFPPPANVWYEGEISTLTNTTLTDNSRKPSEAGCDNPNSWETTPGHVEDPAYAGCCGSQMRLSEFLDGEDEGEHIIPKNYDVVIGGDLQLEAWRIKVSAITANGMYTLNFNDLGLTDAELSGLVGKRYYILRRFGLPSHPRALFANPPRLCFNHAPEPGSLSDKKSVVSLYRAETVAIVEISNHGYSTGNTITLAGATPTAYNGDKTITRIDANHFSYSIAITDPDGIPDSGDETPITPATGAITAHRDGDWVIIDNTHGGMDVWPDDFFVDKKIAFQSSVLGGYLRFGTVINSNRNSVTFTVPSPYVPTGDGAYAIMRESDPAYYTFSLNPSGPFYGPNLEDLDIRWQRSDPDMGQGFYSRFTTSLSFESAVNDLVTPKTNLTIANAGCDGTISEPVFDRDFIIGWETPHFCLALNQSPVDVADQHAFPGFYKSPRGLQAFLDGFSAQWVPPINFADEPAILPFTIAVRNYHASINAHVGTAALDPTGHPGAIGLGTITTGVYEATPLHYTVVWRNVQLLNGVMWVNDGQDVWLDFPSANEIDACNNARYADAHFYWSLGWTRPEVDAQVLWMYQRTYFDPATDEDGTPIAPSATDPGNWPVRAKSTTYAKTNDNFLGAGNPADVEIGRTIESTQPFVNCELARYLASNWIGTSTGVPDSAHPDYGDWIVKGTFEGKLPDNMVGEITGEVAAGGANRLDAPDHVDWLLWGEWDGFTGTATGGSSVTIECSTVAGVDGRWDSSTGRWVGFVVEPTSGPCNGKLAAIRTFDQVHYRIGFNASDLPHFGWQYTKGTIAPAHVGIGDTFSVTAGGSITGSVSFTAAEATAGSVSAGLAAAWNIDGIRAYTDGDNLILEYPTDATITTATTDGDLSDDQTLSLTEETKAVDFRIREPKHMLHRFEGRKVKVTKLDKTVRGTYLIQYSHARTLWLDPGVSVTIEAGDTFEIIERMPGTVWKWSADDGDFVVPPSGASQQAKEKPTQRTLYGGVYKYDNLTAKTLNEMYRAIQALKMTTRGFGWRGPVDEAVKNRFTPSGEYTSEFYHGAHGSTSPATFKGVAGDFLADLGVDPDQYHADPSSDYSTPHVIIGSQVSAGGADIDGNVEYKVFGEGVFFDAVATKGCETYSAVAKWLVYASIDYWGGGYNASDCIVTYEAEGLIFSTERIFNSMGTGLKKNTWNEIASTGYTGIPGSTMSGPASFTLAAILGAEPDEPGLGSNDSMAILNGFDIIDQKIVLDWSANFNYV